MCPVQLQALCWFLCWHAMPLACPELPPPLPSGDLSFLLLSPAVVPERRRELLGQGRTWGWRWTCSALCWEETLGVPSGSCSLQICSEHTETGG